MFLSRVDDLCFKGVRLKNCALLAPGETILEGGRDLIERFIRAKRLREESFVGQSYAISITWLFSKQRQMQFPNRMIHFACR